jgi:hypothetical protein
VKIFEVGFPGSELSLVGSELLFFSALTSGLSGSVSTLLSLIGFFEGLLLVLKGLGVLGVDPLQFIFTLLFLLLELLLGVGHLLGSLSFHGGGSVLPLSHARLGTLGLRHCLGGFLVESGDCFLLLDDLQLKSLFPLKSGFLCCFGVSKLLLGFISGFLCCLFVGL